MLWSSGLNRFEIQSAQRRMKCAAMRQLDPILPGKKFVRHTSLFSLVRARQIDLKHKLAHLYHGKLTYIANCRRPAAASFAEFARWYH
jgi:hypothetical protein